VNEFEEKFTKAISGNREPEGSPEENGPEDFDEVTQMVAELAYNRARRAEVEDAFQKALSRLNASYEEAVSGFDQKIEWYEEALELFHRTAFAIDPKKISIPTPAGTLKSNAGQKKWIYDDEEAFRKWAEDNMPLVFEEPKPAPAPAIKRNEVKKVLADAADAALKVAGTSDAVLTYKGMTVPGLHVEPAGRTFKVETD